jgi:hypothetical protein
MPRPDAPPPRLGRQPSGPRRRVHVLLPVAMHARWRAAAQAEGQTLSGWIRWVCNRRAGRVLR